MPLSSHYKYTDTMASRSKSTTQSEKSTYQQDKNLNEMPESDSQRLSTKTRYHHPDHGPQEGAGALRPSAGQDCCVQENRQAPKWTTPGFTRGVRGQS